MWSFPWPCWLVPAEQEAKLVVAAGRPQVVVNPQAGGQRTELVGGQVREVLTAVGVDDDRPARA